MLIMLYFIIIRSFCKLNQSTKLNWRIGMITLTNPDNPLREKITFQSGDAIIFNEQDQTIYFNREGRPLNVNGIDKILPRINMNNFFTLANLIADLCDLSSTPGEICGSDSHLIQIDFK